MDAEKMAAYCQVKRFLETPQAIALIEKIETETGNPVVYEEGLTIWLYSDLAELFAVYLDSPNLFDAVREQNKKWRESIIAPETCPDHSVVGRYFRGWLKGVIYYCDSYDPHIGYWMTPVKVSDENPNPQRTNVSEWAISRTYHEISEGRLKQEGFPFDLPNSSNLSGS